MKYFATSKMNLVLFAMVLLIGSSIRVQGQNITTLAGNGTAGFSGDGGPAISAELLTPVGMALDASGNIYFADTYNNRIRKITVATGVITTIAGNGYGAGVNPNGGYTGDGGQATLAEFFDPTAVALDAQGNIYVADYGNAAIRKINVSTGIITTVAGGTDGYDGDGGQATAAKLHEPSALALDNAGNIYIVDEGNNVVRKVTVSTGIITNFAGDGEGAGFGGGSGNFTGDGGPANLASLNGPQGIAIDNQNNVYIADAYNNVIRKVNGQTGIISVFAGDSSGFTGYSGDGGLAINAFFNIIAGLAVDAAGNLYVSDEGNNVIRKITVATGIVTTIVGTGTQGFSGDNGPATSATLYGPTSVAVDSHGRIYLTDTGNKRIRGAGAGANAVANISADKNVSIYPNPSNGQINVKLTGQGYQSLKIINSLGQQIYAETLDNSNAGLSLQINTGNIAEGVYFLEVAGENGTSVSQISIQR